MPNWLGITQQQFDLITAMISLQNKGFVASPKEILKEDSELRHAPRIQKSNFFSQLKNLQNREYVKKIGEARYEINFEAIRAALDQKEISIEEEQEEIRKARDQTEKFFMQKVDSEKTPTLEFVEYEEMYSRLANLIRRNDSFYIIGVFPRILYGTSPSLMHSQGAMKYAQVLWRHCFHTKDLDVRYLTYFDVDYIFNKLYTTYNNARHAYDEITLVLKNIENMLKDTPNLHIYYSDITYNVGTVMPYASDPREFFLMLRDTKNRGRGAVYINSPEMGLRFKHLFEEDCARAIDMRGPKGPAIINKAQERLEKLYSKHKKNST